MIMHTIYLFINSTSKNGLDDMIDISVLLEGYAKLPLRIAEKRLMRRNNLIHSNKCD